MSWILLIGAIISEVAATLSLRMASQPGARKSWFAAVGVGYLTAFTFLAFTLAQGMTIGVAYGIWAASGVALTAIAARLLFGEPLNRVMGAGIALIIGGVLMIELGVAH
uniref:DMT family transporter n=1 Tax=Mycolicibacterium neoaurum TaxID=1795 RepID=UPI003F582588